MIYINKLNIRDIDLKRTFVICDFDRTITVSDSGTTWGIFTNNKLVSNKLQEESNKLYNYYWPIEKDTNISIIDKCNLMKEWAIKEASLFGEYGIDKKLFYKIIDSDNTIKIRKDFIDFVNLLYDYNIKLYIVSGGIYDVIDYVFKKNNIILNSNSIISNHIDFTNDYVSGIKGEVIHSCNKNIISLPIEEKSHGILIGDLPGDRLMGEKYDTIDVAFSNNMNIEEYNKIFDIVLTGNSSFKNIGKLLIK